MIEEAEQPAEPYVADAPPVRRGVYEETNRLLAG